MNTTSRRYIGMDVDKQKIAQFIQKQLRECETWVACYEAGSCGFDLYRQLIDLG